jgi:ketosteroid isomerase-like protein
MQIQERGSVTHGAGSPVVTRTPAWLIAVTVVLAVALVALGAWVIVDRAGNDTLPADEVASITQRSIEAWDTGDSQAILDLYAEDATFDVGRDLTGAQEIADYVDELDAMGFVVEPMSATIVEGNTTVTMVAYGGAGDMTPFLAVLEMNPDGLIVNHTGEDVSGAVTVEG